MNRTIKRGIGFIAPALVLLAVTWTAVSVPVRSAPPAEAGKKVDYPPLFADWPKEAPDLLLVVSGETWGFMRPCGCSPGQHGGLARRAGFFDYLKNEKRWNFLPIDFGDLVGKTGRIDLESDRFAAMLKALRMLNYGAIAIGPGDLSLSLDRLVSHAMEVPEVRFTAANVRHRDNDFREILKDTAPALAIGSAGGVKAGVAAVIGESLAEKIKDSNVLLDPIGPAVADALKQMHAANVEVKILLAHVDVSEAVSLAKSHPGFDLIVCRSRFEDSSSSEAKWVGGTMVTWIGQKGKSIGAVGWWRSGSPKLRFEIVPLDLRFKEVAEVGNVYADFVQQIGRSGLLEKWPRTARPDGNRFVGHDKCKDCHFNEHRHWEKKTGHGHAYETLLKKATPPGQALNPECVVCHVAGFGDTSGFYSEAKTPILGGVQCENCHGPSSKHVDDPENPDAYPPVLFSGPESIKQLCLGCHDADNDLYFNFDKDYPLVEHPK